MRGGASVAALALIALMASSPRALALKLPIQASLSGGGEVPANSSPAKGLMEGMFDTDTNMLTWTVTYADLTGPATAAPFMTSSGVTMWG